MSENTLAKQQNQRQDPSASTEKKESSRKPLFRKLNLNQDLKQALHSWDSVSEEVQNKKSPDEEQLQEVKKLLSELKSKLNEFNE